MNTFELFPSFCSELDYSVVAPQAERMAKDLGPFLLLTSEDTLTLVLETLASVARIGDGTWLTAGLVRDLVTAMLQVWAENNKGLLICRCLVIIDPLKGLLRSNSRLRYWGYSQRFRFRKATWRV